jgi:hypothetical protein
MGSTVWQGSTMTSWSWSTVAWGVGLALTATALALLAWGQHTWRRDTHTLRADIARARTPLPARHFDERELDGLPAPVRRYFRRVLKPGQRLIVAAHLRHSGSFNMAESEAKWVPFHSDQFVNTLRPGFDWDARVRMAPGIDVWVHDAYIAGGGVLLAKALGVLTVAHLRGTPELAQGELMRYLGEAVWYPTALLPSMGVRWAELDARRASATLVDGATSVTVIFSFGDDGLIESAYVPERARLVAGKSVMTPWSVQLSRYAEYDGVWIPTEGEVAWVLPGGAYPYWRGQLESMRYEWAEAAP